MDEIDITPGPIALNPFDDPTSSWYIPKPGEFRGRKDYSLHVPKILDLDAKFQMQVDPPPILLNSFDFDTPGYAENLAAHVFSRSGSVDFIPKCSCGYYTGVYYEDSVCPKCHTVATDDMDASKGNLEHKTWISCPDALPGWLHPDIYCILHRWLSYGRRSTRVNYTNTMGDIANRGKEKKGSYLDDIIDVTTKIPEELENVIKGKGMIYLHENFWRIIDYFATQHKSTSQSKDVRNILYFLRMNQDRIFCRYIPIQASSLHSVVVSDGSDETRKKYVDKNCQYVMAAASALSYLEHSTNKRRSINEIEEAAFEAYQNLIAYTFDISVKSLSKKRSLPRAHLFGARFHLTMRGVIVPITGVHQMDELQAPYKSMLNYFRDHVIGRLMWKYGYSCADAVRAHHRAMQVYDEFIYGIMVDLIKESRDGHLWKNFNRNPSIRPGSILQLKVPHYYLKKDPADTTWGFSSLSVSYPNAD